MKAETIKRLDLIRDSVIYRDLYDAFGKSVAERECLMLACTDLLIDFESEYLNGSFVFSDAPYGARYWHAVMKISEKNRSDAAKAARYLVGFSVFFIGLVAGVLCLAIRL